MSVDQLVIKVQSNQSDDESFAEICRRFTGLVQKYAGQQHVMSIRDEAVAEGWLAVVAAVRAYDQTAGVHFAGYVESRVRYAVWNLFKRERRRWQEEQPLTGSSPEGGESQAPGLLDTLAAPVHVEHEVEAGWHEAAVRQALATLPDKQRLAVTRTLLREEPLAAVAGQLGISPQAVYNLRKRGLARLKKKLAGMYESEGR